MTSLNEECKIPLWKQSRIMVAGTEGEKGKPGDGSKREQSFNYEDECILKTQCTALW